MVLPIIVPDVPDLSDRRSMSKVEESDRKEIPCGDEMPAKVLEGPASDEMLIVDSNSASSGIDSCRVRDRDRSILDSLCNAIGDGSRTEALVFLGAFKSGGVKLQCSGSILANNLICSLSLCSSVALFNLASGDLSKHCTVT